MGGQAMRPNRGIFKFNVVQMSRWKIIGDGPTKMHACFVIELKVKCTFRLQRTVPLLLLRLCIKFNVHVCTSFSQMNFFSLSTMASSPISTVCISKRSCSLNAKALDFVLWVSEPANYPHTRETRVQQAVSSKQISDSLSCLGVSLVRRKVREQ